MTGTYDRFNHELHSISMNYRWYYLSSDNLRNPVKHITKVDEVFAARVAAAYEDAAPYSSGAADLAYGALVAQVMQQARVLREHGYDFAIWRGEGEPYANSDAMRRDLIRQKVIYVLPTATAYGGEPFKHHFTREGERLVLRANPLLAWTEYSSKNQPILVNDIFRWVHDVFGHGIFPHQFGAVGEENAYREHRAMFTDTAARALTMETRGQNSWVNFGPHLPRVNGRVARKGEEGYVAPQDRRFADQKINILPDWAMDLY